MLNKPSLKQLMTHVDSKYTLVIVAAKRARSIIINNPKMADIATFNPVSMALKEISDGQIEWTTGQKEEQ